MRTALILGCDGQDGRLICEDLQQQGYHLVGIGRKTVRAVGISWDQTIDITHQPDVEALIKAVSFDEIYYLAASDRSSQDQAQGELDLFKENHAVNVEGLAYVLESVRKYSPETRIFYAASSLIYEDADTEMQDERSAFCPMSFYALGKLNGLLLCRYYRQRHGVFASVGILYNHESSYRQENFLSKKIIRAAREIKDGKRDALVLGDLESAVDWGYAPDYVQAMQQILKATHADEFIVATGVKHRVRDFVRLAFDYAGLDWTQHVKEDPTLLTRKRKVLIGNPQKLMSTTGWRPTVDFKGMVEALSRAEEEVCV